MHVNTPSQCAPARRSSVLMRYWEPHWSYAVRVDCAHLQAENDALHDRLQQCHDHAAKAQPHKCWLSCARSTATLSSQALREDEGVAATSRAAPILSVDFGKSDPPSPLVWFAVNIIPISIGIARYRLAQAASRTNHGTTHPQRQTASERCETADRRGISHLIIVRRSSLVSRGFQESGAQHSSCYTSCTVVVCRGTKLVRQLRAVPVAAGASRHSAQTQ